jgi:hypothetical protein
MRGLGPRICLKTVQQTWVAGTSGGKRRFPPFHRSQNDGDNFSLSALQRAIDPVKLKTALPKELQKLNMSVQSARFRDYGGHAIAEINLEAIISGSRRCASR